MNSESLKRLHEAVEALAEGSLPGFVALDFYARETDSAAPLRRVQVQLRGSLLPLYEAFDVISAEEAAELRAHDGAKPRDVDFLEWLGSTIQVRCLPFPPTCAAPCPARTPLPAPARAACTASHRGSAGPCAAIAPATRAWRAGQQQSSTPFLTRHTPLQEASATAAELDSLKAQLKALCSAMVEQYGLLKVTCSEARSGAAMSVGDASMQIRALNTVRVRLATPASPLCATDATAQTPPSPTPPPSAERPRGVPGSHGQAPRPLCRGAPAGNRARARLPLAGRCERLGAPRQHLPLGRGGQERRGGGGGAPLGPRGPPREFGRHEGACAHCAVQLLAPPPARAR